MAYGDHARQKLDFYKADSPIPTPLVLYIHGGGWVNGDKNGINGQFVRTMLKNGISVASINYRYTTQADAADMKPPVAMAPGRRGARGCN